APIWAYGLRNPWRFAFDGAGNLLIGDVGQDEWEEVDLGLASRKGGENYGWNLREGNHCFRPASGCPSAGLTAPILEYSHAEGCSITGGVVYQGCRMPGYHGTYFYSDYCSSFVRTLRVENGAAVDLRDRSDELGHGLDNVVAFGSDGLGEIYIADYDGEIYQIQPAP